MPESTAGKTKKFGKGERTVPHHSQKAQKWYSVEDEAQPKKVSIHSSDSKQKLDPP
jgi:large subunit ribosomal protein L6e